MAEPPRDAILPARPPRDAGWVSSHMDLRRWVAYAILALLLGAYLVVSLLSLDRLPPVYQDEPWQASVAWRLAVSGTLGSDLFAGWHGADTHLYAFLPLHPIIEGITLRVLGLGLVQLRLASVVPGLAVLVLSYWLGSRLFGRGTGILTVALLLTLHLSARTSTLLTGILLVDVPRVARYDILVPVFGLAALHSYVTARARLRTARRGVAAAIWVVVAGGLAGLAALSHIYGAFWVVVLLLLIAWDRLGVRVAGAAILGFAVVSLPYVAYVLSDIPDWVGQVQLYRGRFQVLDPGWYVANVRAEPERYRPGLGPPGVSWLARPGWWATVAALPLAAVGLIRNGRAGDPAARAMAVPLVALPLLFAVLITSKFPNYLVTVVPLVALGLAWAVGSLWGVGGTRVGLLRAGIVGVLTLVMADGAASIVGMSAAAATTTPYAAFTERIRATIPSGSRILGPHEWWLGLSAFDYRDWLVPLARADEDPGPRDVAVVMALDDVAPDAVLIDSGLHEYLDAPEAGDPKPHAISDWLGSRGFLRTAVVSDRTYGMVEVYLLTGAATPGRER